MSDADKTPAHDATVQGKDSFTGWIGEAMKIAQQVADNEARAQERARLRAKVQAAYDHVGQQGAPGSDPFDAGRLIALRQVLDIIDREAPPHD